MFTLLKKPLNADPSYELREPPASVVIAASTILRALAKDFDEKKIPDAPLEAYHDLRIQMVALLCTLHRADGESMLRILIEQFNGLNATQLPTPVNDTPDATDRLVSVGSYNKPLPAFNPTATVATILDHLDMSEVLRLVQFGLDMLPSRIVEACYEQAESDGVLALFKKKPKPVS